MFEELCVASVMVTNKALRPLIIDPVYDLATEEYQPAEGINEPLPDRLCFTLLNNTPTRPQKACIHKVV